MVKRAVWTIAAIFILAAMAAPALAAYEHYAIRINCGGGAYDASFADHYIADQAYTTGNGAGAIGGIVVSTTVPIDGTTDDPLYQTARQGVNFQYKFDVPNGYYNVKLQFAEIVHDSTRSFLVLINDSVVKSFAGSSVSVAAGGMYKAYDLEFFTNVTNGQILVEFRMQSGAPGWDVSGIINAISVTKVKPPSTGAVQVSGRQILVDGQPFTIKGVGYQPVPVGCTLGWVDPYTTPEIYNRDIPLLRAMHCNVIRTWGKVTSAAFLDACWNGGVDPIYVIMGFHPPNEVDYGDPLVKQAIIDEFKDYVNTYKDHPAVLMWQVGNENNYWNWSYLPDWYEFVNELAWAAYEVEGADYHPVTHPNGGVEILPPAWGDGPIGYPSYNTDDASMTYLDVWAANIYSQWSFEGSLPDYAELSRKPFWISEYGFPGDNERFQAAGADIMWDEIITFSSICSGSAIMAYSDEWWKYNDGNWDEAAWLAHLSKHDFWLGTYNEEYWGVVGIEDTGPTTADKVHPKLVYYTLQEKWAPANEKRNLALGKPAYASSVEGGVTFPAANAVDGDNWTRWSSEASDPQWIYVDLGDVYNIGEVILRWEAAYAAAYEIQVSSDASTWTTVYSTTDGQPYTNFIYLEDSDARGRYVRMYGTARATSYGYSLWEFKVFEPLVDNVAVGKIAYASSVEDNIPELGAVSATDGNFASRWSSGINVPLPPIEDDYVQWIRVDLGAYYDISQIALRWEAAYAKEYKIQASSDGASWTDAYYETDGNGMDDYIDFDPALTVRYLRLYCIKRGTPYGYSLWEFQIKGIISFEYIPPPITSSLFELNINCGGSAYTAVNGDYYIADQQYTSSNGAGYEGGNGSSGSSFMIGGTEDDALYQSDRWGNFSYKFDVPDGYYRVKLRFAETYYDHVGYRVFDVFLEGALVLDDLDIYATAGWCYALDREFITKVTDGQLNITFSSSVDLPKLCAVAVTSEGPFVEPVDNFNDADTGHNSLGFDNWQGSWGDTGVFTTEEEFLHNYYNGNSDQANNAIKFTYDCTDAGFGGWYTWCVWDYVTPRDISDYQYLSLRIKRASGNEAAYVKVKYGESGQDPQETPLLYLPSYCASGNAWQLVNIPLADFTGLDKTTVREVVFVFLHDGNPFIDSGILYVDNLEFSNGYAKPESAGPVRIDRETKTLFVDGAPYYIKGVGYEPVPIGSFPPIDTIGVYDRDLPLLVDMGCNTIRIWHMPGMNALNKAEEYGIKVLAGFWMNYDVDFSSPAVRDSIKQQFISFVNIYKDSPALLVWAIGNENNYVNGSNYYYYSLCNELAKTAYQIEGASYHPVIIVNGHLYNMGVEEYWADDLQLDYIDAWGCNLYGEEFDAMYWGGEQHRDIFEVFEQKSSKPLIITEYGCDAFRTTDPQTLEGYEDEDMQSDWVRTNLLDIMAAQDVCAGSTIMAYADEWWKDPAGSPWQHDKGGWAGAGWGAYPDDYANEEYWGIVEIAPDGTWSASDGLDDVRPRKVYNTLKLIFEGAKVVEPGGSIQAAIDGASSGDTIYITDGVFEEDISVKGKDDITLLGDGAAGTVIKSNILFENSDSSIEGVSVYYAEGGMLNYTDSYYTDLKLAGDAGISAVNSDIAVKNCIIMPDPDIFGDDKFSKAVQILNLYGNPDITPLIENCEISNADTAIYLYSQASGGAILGNIKDNTLDMNNYGITLRMHEENPVIDGNTFENSTQDAIHITYEDGSLLTDRLSNISNNHFIGNTRNAYCDEAGSEVTPTGPGNIYE